MNFKKLRSILLLTTTLLLSGCFFPQDYEADISFAGDGSYTFSYSGNLVNVLYRAAVLEGTKMNAADEKTLEDDAVRMSKDKDVKSIKYAGKGIYKLKFEKSIAAGKNHTFLDKTSKIFEVIHKKDGSIEIKSPKINPEEMKKLEKMDLKPSGEVSLKLPKGAVIEKQNADSTPTMGFGSYKWKISDLSKQVSIIFKIPKK